MHLQAAEGRVQPSDGAAHGLDHVEELGCIILEVKAWHKLVQGAKQWHELVQGAKQWHELVQGAKRWHELVRVQSGACSCMRHTPACTTRQQAAQAHR